MDASHKLLRPEFSSAFTCWFNSDDIDLNDMDDVMSRADTVAMTLLQAGLTPEEAAAPLDEALRRWTPEVLKEFCDAGNIAWDFDEEEEQMLRTVLERIILTARGGSDLTRTVNREEYLRMHAAGLPDGQEGPG